MHIRTWQVAYAHMFPAQGLASLEDRRAERERFWVDAVVHVPPRSHRLVAERAGHVLGFASAGPANDDESLGELYAIYVLPEEWGRGAGSALMAMTLERLRRSGFREAVLWVLDDNPRARAFYERSGWSPDDVRREVKHLDTVTREVRYRIDLDDRGL